MFSATPILSLHPVECSIFTDATISSNFQYVWAVTPHSLYVWNIPALRRNIQASFVYSLPRSIRGDIVEFLVDPHSKWLSFSLTETSVVARISLLFIITPGV